MSTPVTLLAYFTVLCLQQVYGDVPLVKLSSGVHLEPIPKIHYESSANLLYEIKIPNIDYDFLSEHNCTGAECLFHRHIKELIKDTLVLLNNTLPSAEDLPNTKNKRALNFNADFSNWCCGFATQGEVESLTNSESDMLKIINSMKNQIAREHEAAIQSKMLINEYSEQMKKIMSKNI